jgi:hypothetical protein
MMRNQMVGLLPSRQDGMWRGGDASADVCGRALAGSGVPCRHRGTSARAGCGRLGARARAGGEGVAATGAPVH